MEAKLEECLEYFQSRSVFRKLFSGFRDKMISLGHFGGKVVLTKLTLPEIEQLEGFLQRSFRGQNQVSITAGMMQKALENSRFAGILWENVLEAYFHEPVVGKREQERQRQQEQREFFEAFCMDAKAGETQKDEGLSGGLWLKNVLEQKDGGYRLLVHQYGADRDRLADTLKYVLKAVEELPQGRQKYEALPVFSARVTGDPHFFDENTVAGKLLELYLTDAFQMERETSFSGSEWKSRVLYQGGILKDDLSNFTLIYGIHGKDSAGRLHEGMEGFVTRREPMQCTLFTIGKLGTAVGNRDIYLVENPAVFSVLTARYPEISMMCTNGQPRLASLLLLDLLCRNSILWYAGDFDPEGLLIAQNFHRRYGTAFRYWNYLPENYARAMSEVILKESRLKKLDRITDEELLPVAKMIRQNRRAAYQETMLAWGYELFEE